MDRSDQSVGVVGAGLMGAEIALVYAMAGYSTILVDRDEGLVGQAMQRLAQVGEKAATRGLIPIDLSQTALSRISTGVDVALLASADLVTEAIFEDVEAKSRLLRSLDAVCKPECLLATNTSTIPISTLSANLAQNRRERFIGMHYFSPVSRMKLVEIIPGFDTSAATVEAAKAFCLAVGKVSIDVKDVPGFAVNRVLHAFIIEAIRLVEEGVASPEDIDIACRLGLGHPMGPFELMDSVTSSLCLQAQEIMHDAYGERFRPPPLLKQRVHSGRVGGRGRPGWIVKDRR